MRQLILLLSALCLWATSAQAAFTPWDDELEPGNSGYNLTDMYSRPACGGVTSFQNDTTIKKSGSGSLKEGFPAASLTNPQLCGGFFDRSVDTTDLWIRFYARLSPGFTVGGYTKMIALYGSVPGRSPGGWIEMANGSTNVIFAAEHYPLAGNATLFKPNGDSNARTSPEGGFVCFEVRIKTNTVDVANGIMQIYKEGTLVLNRQDVMWLRDDQGNAASKMITVRLYRQAGSGFINYDRLAASSTRIGCIGAPPPGDTTPPSPPTNLTVN